MKDVLNEKWVMARKNRNHGLQPLKDALKNCGNPEKSLNVVHVAGTNGKGSTTNFLKDLLVAHGYKVGMFTSPHLVEHRDRIRINDDWIPKTVFLSYLETFREEILEKDLGMFEIDELITLNYFHDEQVDYVLLETGLGGRLDQTNCVEHTILDIITTIGFDHMNILGNRIEQIAFEKAGILKPYGHSVIGILPNKAKKIITKNAIRKHHAIHERKPYQNLGNQCFAYDKDVYQLSSLATYQMDNASLALEAAWMLGIDIHDTLSHRAIQSSHWPGRFEVIQEDPKVILDGAHNEEGIKALVQSLKAFQQEKIIVFSALKDKEFQKMFTLLKETGNTIIVTYFENDRSESLENAFANEAIWVSNYSKAIQQAIIMAKKEKIVVVTGSLYFISLAREVLFSEKIMKAV